MRSVVCLPTYNERENLSPLVEEILRECDADVMVIDDDSPDGTGYTADGLAKNQPRVVVVHRHHKEGLGRAYLDAFDRALSAGYDRILQMDADFSHQPRYLPAMISALGNADVVIGSRYVPGGGVDQWGIARRLLSRASNAYACRVLRTPFHDATAGFVGWRRNVLEAIDLPSIASNGYAFQVELKHRAHRRGFHIAEIPIHFWDRVVGRPKLDVPDMVHTAFYIAKLRRHGWRS